MNIQLTVKVPVDINTYKKIFVFVDDEADIERVNKITSKLGCSCELSTKAEIEWFDDPEFNMDGDDEPCFCLPDEEAELILTIKDL